MKQSSSKKRSASIAGDLALETPAGNPFQRMMYRLRRSLSSTASVYGYLLLAGLVPAVLSFLIYLARGIFPFGDSTVLVLDLNGQYVSFYEAIFHFARGDASLLYSFSRALGGEFLGIFDYYVASPFIWLFVLFPQEWMQEILLALFLLKTGLCGVTMGFYLHKHSKSPNQLAIIAFSTMYALTSYGIVQQHNSMWIDAVLWLPILTYGIEELIKKGRFRLFVATLALSVISNFYIGYMVCIYVVVYCFFYYFAHNQNNENNPLGEKNHFIRSVIRTICWMVLAIGISALTILSARYALSLGKSDFSSPNWALEQKFNLFDFLYKFLPSSYDTVRPQGLPFVYCGMLTLVLVPTFFMSKKISKREKIASGVLILFFVVSFALSTLDLIWHGFQKPNWLNYRYSFMLCFFLIVLAARAFDNIRYTSRKALLGTVSLIGLFVLVAQMLGKDFLFIDVQNAMSNADKFKIHEFATIWLAIGCLAVYFVLMCLLAKSKKKKELLALILAIFVCVEVFLSGLSDLNSLGTDVGFTTHSKYAALGETFRPIVDTVEGYDNGFYRMEKTFTRKKNDNMTLNIKGLSNSTSTLNKDTVLFLHQMGYASESNWTEYIGGTPVNDSILGVKYLISNLDLSHYYGKPIFGPDDYGYDDDYTFPKNYFGSHGSSSMTTDYVTSIEDFYVYENPYALSIAFGVDNAMADFELNSEDYKNPFERMNAMITAMLGEEETVQVFVPATQNGEPLLDNVVRSQTATQLLYKAVDTERPATLTYSYTIPQNTDVFFYYPTNNDREAHLNINNRYSYDPYDDTSQYKTGADHERIVCLGSYENSDMTVKMTIKNKYNNLYVLKDCESYVYYIDWDVFTDAMTRLSNTELVVDKDVTDDHLTGSLKTLSDDQMILTTIPYDEGWNVTVDGKAVEIEESADALVAFRVADAGEHRVELRYMPKTIALGIGCTLICTVIFVAILILYPFFKNKRPIKGLILVAGEEQPPVQTEEDEADVELGDLGEDDPEEESSPRHTKTQKK